jgi:isoleucyl-tRNA synthetase
VLCRAAAPLLPLVTESVWRGLTGGLSVHLTDWPAVDTLPADPALVASMDRVREVCSAAHSVRKAKGLRARLPLASLTVAAPDADRLAPFVELIADEVNVKEVRLTTDVDTVADRTLTVVFKVAAPRLGPVTPKVAAAAKQGDWELLDDGRARVGDSVLLPGEFERRLRPRSADASRSLPSNDGLVILDLEVSESLEAEGMARDLVRVVQQARRDAGLQVSDRIRLELSVPPAVAVAVESHRAWLAEQTLAVDFEIHAGDGPPAGDNWHEAQLPDGRPVWLRLRRN